MHDSLAFYQNAAMIAAFAVMNYHDFRRQAEGAHIYSRHDCMPRATQLLLARR